MTGILAFDRGNIVSMTQETGWRRAGVAVFIAAGVLLFSMGGAIIAAPVIAGLTVAEFAWAAAYVTAGEAKPWIWLIPCVAAVGALVAFVSASRPTRLANY